MPGLVFCRRAHIYELDIALRNSFLEFIHGEIGLLSVAVTGNQKEKAAKSGIKTVLTMHNYIFNWHYYKGGSYKTADKLFATFVATAQCSRKMQKPEQKNNINDYYEIIIRFYTVFFR